MKPSQQRKLVLTEPQLDASSPCSDDHLPGRKESEDLKRSWQEATDTIYTAHIPKCHRRKLSSPWCATKGRNDADALEASKPSDQEPPRTQELLSTWSGPNQALTPHHLCQITDVLLWHTIGAMLGSTGSASSAMNELLK